MDIHLLQQASGRNGEKIYVIIAFDGIAQSIEETISSVMSSDFPMDDIEIIIASAVDNEIVRGLERRYEDNILLVLTDDMDSNRLIKAAMDYIGEGWTLLLNPGDTLERSTLADLYTRSVLLNADIAILNGAETRPHKYGREYLDIKDIFTRRQLLVEYGTDTMPIGKLINVCFLIGSNLLSYDSMRLNILKAYLYATRVVFASTSGNLREYRSEVSDDEITKFRRDEQYDHLQKEIEYCLFDICCKCDRVYEWTSDLINNIRYNPYIIENRNTTVRDSAKKIIGKSSRHNDIGCVYITAPENVTSGGPELLHQLCYTLNNAGIRSKIVYFDVNGVAVDADVPDIYRKYHVTTETDIREIDRSDNIVVCSESYTVLTTYVKKARKVIFWESVDFYLDSAFIKYTIEHDGDRDPLHFAEDSSYYHLVQSLYAFDFLNESMHIDTGQIAWLSDYISDEFREDRVREKKNEVAYNPAKGYDVLKQIIDVTPDIQWRPIKDMSPEQVHDLLLESKLYIDFGFHPGKDRIPREAAASGCVVITNTNGAAGYADVPIPDKYKFEDPAGQDRDRVVRMIHYILDNYDKCYEDFVDYRDMIAGEKQRFNEDAGYVFGEWIR